MMQQQKVQPKQHKMAKGQGGPTKLPVRNNGTAEAEGSEPQQKPSSISLNSPASLSEDDLGSTSIFDCYIPPLK